MGPELGIVATVVGLPFLAAALAPFAYRVIGERMAYAAAGVAAVCLFLVTSMIGSQGSVAIPWIPSMNVSMRFYVDGLANLIGLLASGIGVLIFVYSYGYMHHEPGKSRFYATLLAFMGSMLGVAYAADLIWLFVFWELTSVFSYLLIGHYRAPRASQYAARKAMLITVGGGLFMLVGFVFLHVAAMPVLGSTFDLVAMIEAAGPIRDQLRAQGLFVPALILLAVGIAAKSAQVPLHLWLPNAMEAPTPVSAFLHSATMVKAGVYLVGRLRPFFLPAEEWSALFIALGLVTMAITAMLAVAATDIKELLAYSTASHLGLIVAGFGFGSVLGAEAAGFHILNHATFKAALFLVAGIVAHEAGTRRIDELGGLATELPITAAVTGVAALSMAGIPPFNGFYSKEFLFEAAYHVAADSGGVTWLYPAIAVFASIFTVLYSLRFLWLFLGSRPDAIADRDIHRPPLSMLIPAGILAGAAAIIGIGGLLGAAGIHVGPIEKFVEAVVEGSSPATSEVHFAYYLPTSLSPALVMSAIAVGGGVFAFPIYDQIHRVSRAALRGPVTANWWYDGGVEALATASERLTLRVQNGRLRTYAIWTFIGVVGLTVGGYAATAQRVAVPFPNLPVMMVIILGIAVLAALAIGRAPSHVAGVLTLSIFGFMIAIFYILANAPDLALTQLVVETLVLLLFLLVLDRLPAYYGEIRRGVAVRDGILSVAVGAVVALTVLVSTGGEPASVVADRLVERAPLPHGVPKHGVAVFHDVGGGGNVVNVILVDFRAFDTLGEITVVALAALSVVTLLGMRERGEQE